MGDNSGDVNVSITLFNDSAIAIRPLHEEKQQEHRRLPKRDHFGVAIICALPLEATAVEALFEEKWDAAEVGKARGDVNSYSLGRIGPHRVVLVHMRSMGKVSAATAADHLKISFRNVGLVLLVGICGGAPNVSAKRSDELLLGDVVVSTGVVQYDFGRKFKDEFVKKDSLVDNLSGLSLEARGLLAKLQTKDNRERLHNSVSQHLGTLVLRLGSTAERPPRSDDKLFRTEYLHKHRVVSDCPVCASGNDKACNAVREMSCEQLGCDQQDTSNLVPRLRPEELSEPVLHFGLFASGDTVMKSGKDRDEIAAREGAIAFEMEGAGMWEILRACSCLVVKSICDYADSHKNKKFQGYAAAVAAATAKALLESWVPYAPETDGTLDPQDTKLVSKLRKVPYRDRKDRNPRHVEGTCQWFVGHKRFRDWLEGSEGTPGALWVSADPGCGKSVLAKHLVDHVLPSTKSRTTCYFFFKDDFPDQKSVANAISCILHQLFTQRPALLTDSVRNQIEASGERLVESFRDLWNLLLGAAEHEEAGEILCVLDALDECESGDRALLAAELVDLHRTKRAPNLRFLLTSRPYGNIRRGFQSSDSPDLALVHLSGEDEAEIQQISKEIDIVIRARVQGIAGKLVLDETERDLLLTGLLGVPHRTYLWVYLTLDLIEKEEYISKTRIINATKHLPGSVDEAYERILSESRKPEEAKRAFQIILAAERPLQLRELQCALALRSSHRSHKDLDIVPDERFRERLRDVCGLLVTVVESEVFLLHQTAREFLLGSDSPETATLQSHWKHFVHMPQAHRILGEACITLLQFPELHKDDLEFDSSIDYFVYYATAYWPTHIRASGVLTQDERLLESVLQLCRTIAQRWPGWIPYYMRVSTHLPVPKGLTLVTPLMVASFFGVAPAVRALMKAGGTSSVHARDSLGRTALSWAAAAGQHDAVKVLLRDKSGMLKNLGKLASWRLPDIQSQDSDGMTPLMHAVRKRSEAVVELLLQRGADIAARDQTGKTALHWASRSLNTNIAKLLLAHGADIEARDSQGYTPLIWAAEGSYDDAVELLLDKGANIDATEAEGRTALLTLIIRSYVDKTQHDTARLLLTHGANPDVRDPRGFTALLWAVCWGVDYMTTVKLLVEGGADVNLRNPKTGRSPFRAACDRAKPELVRFLLESGANLETDTCGLDPCPFCSACGFGRLAVVELLIEKGVSATPENHPNCNPGPFAEAAAGAFASGLTESYIKLGKLLLSMGADIEAKYSEEGASVLGVHVQVYDDPDVIRWLLDLGADIESRDPRGRTPLARAAISWKSRTAVQVLLQAGANPNAADVGGRPILSQAILARRKRDLLQQLLDHGADIEQRDDSGRTPLSLACGPGARPDTVKLLLERGCNVHSKDNRGRTPLLWATHKSVDTAVAKLLIEAGADISPDGETGWAPLAVASGEQGNPQTAQFLRELGAGGE